MLLKDFKPLFISKLEKTYDLDEINSFFYILLEKFFNFKRVDFILKPNFELPKADLLKWEYVIFELQKQKPIQYILGETYFYGNYFKVNDHTLIPRPETEELVDLIVKNTSKNKPILILDIGTGSGCIAISLAKALPNAQVFGLDISGEALKIAKQNADLNEVTVNFIQESVLDIENLPLIFDIIVSNPPYVRNLEKNEILPNVLEFEPHLALFVEDDDALLFYRKITQLSKNNLNQKGKLYFEINQYLGIETKELIEKYGFKNVKIIKDFKGNDRIVEACFE